MKVLLAVDVPFALELDCLEICLRSILTGCIDIAICEGRADGLEPMRASEYVAAIRERGEKSSGLTMGDTKMTHNDHFQNVKRALGDAVSSYDWSEDLLSLNDISHSIHPSATRKNWRQLFVLTPFMTCSKGSEDHRGLLTSSNMKGISLKWVPIPSNEASSCATKGYDNNNTKKKQALDEGESYYLPSSISVIRMAGLRFGFQHVPPSVVVCPGTQDTGKSMHQRWLWGCDAKLLSNSNACDIELFALQPPWPSTTRKSATHTDRGSPSLLPELMIKGTLSRAPPSWCSSASPYLCALSPNKKESGKAGSREWGDMALIFSGCARDGNLIGVEILLPQTKSSSDEDPPPAVAAIKCILQPLTTHLAVLLVAEGGGGAFPLRKRKFLEKKTEKRRRHRRLTRKTHEQEQQHPHHLGDEQPLLQQQSGGGGGSSNNSSSQSNGYAGCDKNDSVKGSRSSGGISSSSSKQLALDMLNTYEKVLKKQAKFSLLYSALDRLSSADESTLRPADICELLTEANVLKDAHQMMEERTEDGKDRVHLFALQVVLRLEYTKWALKLSPPKKAKDPIHKSQHNRKVEILNQMPILTNVVLWKINKKFGDVAENWKPHRKDSSSSSLSERTLPINSNHLNRNKSNSRKGLHLLQSKTQPSPLDEQQQAGTRGRDSWHMKNLPTTAGKKNRLTRARRSSSTSSSSSSGGGGGGGRKEDRKGGKLNGLTEKKKLWKSTKGKFKKPEGVSLAPHAMRTMGNVFQPQKFRVVVSLDSNTEVSDAAAFKVSKKQLQERFKIPFSKSKQYGNEKAPTSGLNGKEDVIAASECDELEISKETTDSPLPSKPA
eukprot:jgi/Bigna1/132851/aug1.19_g7559